MAGSPSEYFCPIERSERAAGWGANDFAAYLEAVRRHGSTTNGVFGMKLMWNDFGPFLAELRADSDRWAATDVDVLDQTFPGLRYVWLRRQDKVRQGISWWRAAVTQQWSLMAGEERRPAELDVAGMANLVRYATDCDEGWRAWFDDHDVHPLEITYEELVEDRLATVNRVLEHLDLRPLGPGGLPPAIYRRQADELTERCHEDVRAALAEAETAPVE